MKKALIGLLVALCALAAHATSPAKPEVGTASGDQKPPLTVVYWTSNDCRWCTWWEGKIIGSGGEAKFLSSREGKAVKYVVVKKPLLSVPYQVSDFKPETMWLWEKMKSSQVDGEGRIRGFPSFSLFEGDKLAAYALGEPDVEKKLMPAIRERIPK